MHRSSRRDLNPLVTCAARRTQPPSRAVRTYLAPSSGYRGARGCRCERVREDAWRRSRPPAAGLIPAVIRQEEDCHFYLTHPLAGVLPELSNRVKAR